MSHDAYDTDRDVWHDELQTTGHLVGTTDYAVEDDRWGWWRSDERLCPLCLREGMLTPISNRAETCREHKPLAAKIKRKVEALVALDRRLKRLDSLAKEIANRDMAIAERRARGG